MAHEQQWLICYDIRQPARLAKIHRFLRQEALALQKSVFYARLTRQELDGIVAQLQQLMDETVDDIRIFPLQAGQSIRWHGRPLLPECIDFGPAPDICDW